ncbi:MAG: hypothetical protein M0Q52_11995 [Lascolabacillus sp.]|nr:hypothetical protein [Lascolabacillus sp.]
MIIIPNLPLIPEATYPSNNPHHLFGEFSILSFARKLCQMQKVIKGRPIRNVNIPRLICGDRPRSFIRSEKSSGIDGIEKIFCARLGNYQLKSALRMLIALCH